MWQVEYDSDTGVGNETSTEWWTVSDGERFFETKSDGNAKWLCDLLNVDNEKNTTLLLHLNNDADNETIEDGFGSSWSAWCPMCKRKSMEVVRPGKVQCGCCG